MLNKDDILNKTDGGMEVFRHYISSDLRLGKPFCNPLYADSKASCSIYWNKKANCYYFKDFGNSDYCGDCFYLVGQLKGLNCQNPQQFIEIINTINSDMCFSSPTGVPPTRRAKSASKSRDIPDAYSFNEQMFSEVELQYWQQYGIDYDTLMAYNVISIDEYKSVSNGNKPFKLSSSRNEPIYGYRFSDFIKIYRPFSQLRFCYGGNKPEGYCFGLEQLPSKGNILFITGGEKDVLSLAAHGFYAICFNSETAEIPQNIIAALSHRFKHIVLLYDVDETGLKQSEIHCKTLSSFDVKRLLLPLEGTKEQKDISDYFRAGHSKKELITLFVEMLNTMYYDTFAMLSPCEIDLQNPPITPQTLISINDVPIATEGNLLCITGSEGSGKSNYVGALIAGMISRSDMQIDTLGLNVAHNTNFQSLLLFDTEQSESQLYKNLCGVLKRSCETFMPDWFKAYSLVCLSRKQRIKAITESMDKFYYENSGIRLVVIDGIADLIGCANDEAASIEIVDELYRLASIYNTCIVCVLHFVPNGIKLRGHLGSELQRKAATILSIEKEEEPLSVVKALKVRDGSPLDVPIMQFSWCSKKGMHVYRGEKSREDKENRKETELRNLAKQLYSTCGQYGYLELCRQIQDKMDVSERTAKSYIRYMRDKEIIYNNADNILCLSKHI